MPDRILVVDDDPQMALAMAQVLGRQGYDVSRARNGNEALSAMAKTEYDLVVTDLRMPEMDGHELVRRIHVLSPRVRVIVVTAHGTVESAVTCVRDGAADYLMKPFSPAALVETVRRALQQQPSRERRDDSFDLVAVDPATEEALSLARKAAGSDVTVLLEGESGVGKEVFARLIHRESPRRNGPFVAVNCAALPRELLEAELFGHRKGAFTGAMKDRKGHFQAADGGTLLLDEIGEMSVDLQSRLLRVLQDHLVQPIGSETPVKVDVRVIAATNKSLREETAAGRFREDLYYRLRVLPIDIPPLRRRPADIEPLASRFARRYAGEDAEITPEAMRRLALHRWPGNVRELQNAIQRAAILSAGDPIGLEHLSLEPGFHDAEERPAAAPMTLEDAEREAIRRILDLTGGNRTEAAAALGISPRTLRHKLKQYKDSGRPLVLTA